MGDEDVTLGEVYRLTKKIDARFDTFAATYVPLSLFQAVQKTHDDKVASLGREIAQERAERKIASQKEEAEREKLEAQIDGDKKTKAQQWFAIGLAGFVALLGIVGTIVSTTLLQGLIASGGP